MPKIRYKDIKFRGETLALIDKCNTLIASYTEQGFVLTLRQLYYQLVSRAVIANKQTEYDRLGSIVNDARLAGLIDWHCIQDRTRNLMGLAHWAHPSEIIQSAAYSFRRDMWVRQTYRPEVWIEKDALVGVIQGVCNEYDVPYFSCRGYTSQSEMWVASQRLKSYANAGQAPVILHFGDHDPSGQDMTRDITDRFALFMGGIPVRRIALNMPQVRQYGPPPNPAKITDSRYQTYIKEYGPESWELDALEPRVIAGLVREEVRKLIEWPAWEICQRGNEQSRAVLTLLAANYDKVTKGLARKTKGGKAK